MCAAGPAPKSPAAGRSEGGAGRRGGVRKAVGFCAPAPLGWVSPAAACRLEQHRTRTWPAPPLLASTTQPAIQRRQLSPAHLEHRAVHQAKQAHGQPGHGLRGRLAPAGGGPHQQRGAGGDQAPGGQQQRRGVRGQLLHGHHGGAPEEEGRHQQRRLQRCAQQACSGWAGAAARRVGQPPASRPARERQLSMPRQRRTTTPHRHACMLPAHRHPPAASCRPPPLPVLPARQPWARAAAARRPQRRMPPRCQCQSTRGAAPAPHPAAAPPLLPRLPAAAAAAAGCPAAAPRAHVRRGGAACWRRRRRRGGRAATASVGCSPRAPAGTCPANSTAWWACGLLAALAVVWLQGQAKASTRGSPAGLAGLRQ